MKNSDGAQMDTDQWGLAPQCLSKITNQSALHRSAAGFTATRYLMEGDTNSMTKTVHPKNSITMGMVLAILCK